MVKNIKKKNVINCITYTHTENINNKYRLLNKIKAGEKFKTIMINKTEKVLIKT